MTKTIKIILLSILILAAVGITSYLYVIPKYIYGPEATVRKLIKILNNDKSINQDEIFSFNYSMAIIRNNTYIIENPEYEIKQDGENRWIVVIKGTITNGLGMQRKKDFGFILTKDLGQYLIADSYDFIAFNETNAVFTSNESDLEKSKILSELKNNLEIIDWKFESSYGDAIKGSGRIKNNSSIPVKFVECKLYYSDRKDQQTNTDKFYAVGADELFPGEVRGFEWYTSTCYKCNTARITIDIK